MAQESRIKSFEQALKDEGIAGTNLEPVARSIFAQESSSGANVKTSNAGARGPMQVLPTTFKAYNPQGNIDDPYDNSVGGLRYIKDLFSKTNDPGLTAIGYYGGPKAIEKAKQGIAVSDPRNPNAPNTLQYMEQVMGRTKTEPTGKAPAKQVTPKGDKPPVNPLIEQKITDLGPSYQAALALMAKGDDLDEAREKIAEEDEIASAGADFSQARKMLTQLQPIRAFADGGEAKKPEPSLGENVKGTAKEILRSIQYTPYDLLGAPVDIGNLALKGVDYVTGSKLATEKPVGGSDYLIQKSRELGIADKPTGSTTETLTRLGTGILSPTAGPRAVVAAGQAVKGTAKAALEDLAMASTGQGGSKVAQQLMAPGTAFAVRPKGGAYLGASSVDEPPLSGFDVKIKDFTANLDRNDPLQKEVLNFFDKKLRNYVTNQQGTVDDPIFKKLLEGKIENFTHESAEKFAAARAGDKEALKAVRDAYDAAVPVNAYVGGKYGKTSSELGKLEQSVAAKIKEQSPDNYTTTLMTQARRVDPNELEKYSALYSAPGFKQFSQEAEAGPLQRILNKTNLPPHLRRAIAEGEPVYATTGFSNVILDRVTDMSQIRDYLLNRSPAEIKNMGVADVVEKSEQWHAKLAAARRDPKNFSRKQLFEGTEEVMPLSNNTQIVDVKTKDALALEGNIMKHCVGGSNYCSGVEKGDIKIYSLRDKNGIPQATIELRMGSDQKYNNVFQVKGVKDKPVEKEFLPMVDEFLTKYSDKLGDTPLIINESPRFLPENWRSE